MNKKIAFLIGALMMCNGAYATDIPGAVAEQWGMNGGFDMFDFKSVANNDGILLASTTDVNVPNSKTVGTGYVVYAAFEIVTHGGYFCPVQINCESKNSLVKSNVWFVMVQPNGFSNEQCAWLCTDGYSGDKCAVAPNSTPLMCDAASFDKNDSNSRFSGLSARTSYEDRPSSDFPRVNNGSRPSSAVFLGMVAPAGEHGAKIAPIKMTCNHRDKKQTSFAATKYNEAKMKLACAEGYVPSSNGDSCMPKDAELCGTMGTTSKWCNYFPRDGYNPDEHYLETSTEDSCVRYLCKKDGYAFASGTSQNCVKCGTNTFQYGQSNKTGLCKSCDSGQFFKKTADACEDAVVYNHTELAYGKNRDDNPNRPKSGTTTTECWMRQGAEYSSCVTGTSSSN